MFWPFKSRFVTVKLIGVLPDNFQENVKFKKGTLIGEAFEQLGMSVKIGYDIRRGKAETHRFSRVREGDVLIAEKQDPNRIRIQEDRPYYCSGF